MTDSLPPRMFPASLPLSLRRTWTGQHHGQILALSFNCDGSLFVTGGRDGIISIFDISEDMPVAHLYLDAGLAATALSWVENTLWIGASDGSIASWKVEHAPQGVSIEIQDVIPVHLPAPPRILEIFRDGHKPKQCTYLVAAYRNTTEVWSLDSSVRQSKGDNEMWQGLGQCTSTDQGDKVIRCWPLHASAALVVFRTQGIRLWTFTQDMQNILAGWPREAIIHAAHISHSQQSEAESGLLGQVIVVTSTAVMHFALILIPIPHLQLLQQFPLLPNMTTLSSCTTWGMSPTLITHSPAGLVAIDLTFHRYQLVTGSLQDRTTQVIQPDDGNIHSRLSSTSGPTGRHVASVSRGHAGWNVHLWSAANETQASGTFKTGGSSATPIIRVYESYQRLHSRDHRPAGASSSHRLMIAAKITFALVVLSYGCKYLCHSYESVSAVGAWTGNTSEAHQAKAETPERADSPLRSALFSQAEVEECSGIPFDVPGLAACAA